MPKKAFRLILTVGLISAILGATMAWFHDVGVSRDNVFTAAEVFPQPCLWIWRHGGKVWPEWHVGYYNETQILYARIINDGNRSAYVKIEFIVYRGTVPVRVNSTIAECDGIPPGNVTVSAEYHPSRPGTYYVKAKLWFSIDEIHWKLWLDFQEEFGGEGVSKTASSKFKVRG